MTSKPVYKQFLPAKAYWKEVLAMLILLLAIVFFRSERREVHAIVPHLRRSDPHWLLAGSFLTLLYCFAQAGIYKKSFAAISLSLSWSKALILFLKRNLISVFLPAGGISSLAYSPSQIRKAGFDKTQVYQASGLFGFAGLLTVFLAGVPVVIFAALQTNHRFSDAWAGLAILLLLIGMLVTVVRSIKNQGRFHALINRFFPALVPAVNKLFAANVNIKSFSGAVAYSMGVELCGMLHIYIAMLALHLPAQFGAAATAYIVAVLMMVISPFLRGLGAVELSLVWVLQQAGYRADQALAVTVLYRVFEFWLPLVAGLFTYAWKSRMIFLRIAPALLAFALGIVNILSAITPPIRRRMHLLLQFLPWSTIHASNLLVLFTGLSLLVTAAFLLRGLRTAWIIALTLSAVSLIGHVTKALDYEEALLAATTLAVLTITASQYRLRSSNKWMKAGVATAVISSVAVILLGFVSFYFIDRRHFGINFSWQQSMIHTLKIFLLVEDDTLHPHTRFAHEFIGLVRSLGFITGGFLLFTLIKPHLGKLSGSEGYREKASHLLDRFGGSTTDYFKLCKDKTHFFSEQYEAFVSYRITGSFAIVLDEPVCAGADKPAVLAEFDRYCHRAGLRTAFYRVDETSLPWFGQLKKNKLMIGQEAILDINHFTLEGKEKKSLRNGLNGLQKHGYSIHTYKAPHDTGFLDRLKQVSDDWLEYYGKRELTFSQGMFDEAELCRQDIITVEDGDGTIKSFLTIIPSYAKGECTYDLIRKTGDAPGAAIDALITTLIGYARAHHHQYLNLGLVPMTGINQPDGTAEQLIKLAAAKIKRFQHYQGLREFKEKYATLWENKYLMYDNDFDLLQLPVALNNVMRP